MLVDELRGLDQPTNTKDSPCTSTIHHQSIKHKFEESTEKDKWNSKIKKTVPSLL